jgi:ABC-2 type transport system ATP-binding protein
MKAVTNSSNNYNKDNNYDGSVYTVNLTKAYKNFRAVDALTIDVHNGDIFGFLGPNGAGKTTTIRMLCGLLSPSAGTAKIAGLDIVKDSLKIRNIIGLLPESSGFYNWMSAQEYLLHFAALYKIELQIAKKKAKDLLEKVGLAVKSFAPIGYYSRGMKQRLGLARTLINEPKIIFLDEPTLGLDPKGQQDIQKLLLELNQDKNVTIFLSSHALSEVSSLCNRIAIVNHGRLIAQGDIKELRKLAGSTSDLLLVTVLNSQSAHIALSKLPFQIKLQTNGEDKDRLVDVIVVSEGIFESANDIINIFQKTGLQIYEIRRMGMSLEDVFFKLTEKDKDRKKQQLSHLQGLHDDDSSYSVEVEQQKRGKDGD